MGVLAVYPLIGGAQGQFGQKINHLGHLSNRGQDVDTHTRVQRFDFLHQEGQILSGMFANAQKKRKNSHRACPALNQVLQTGFQIGLIELEVSQTHELLGGQLLNPLGNGLDGDSPQRVARAMGKEDRGFQDSSIQ